MKKTLLKYFTVALITISTISMPLTVKAAQKSNISIRPNVAYSKYDITGDGKADKIRINFKSESYLNIEVNGKKSFSLNAQNIYLVNADLYTLNGNKHFLKLKCQDIDNDHIDYDKLLTYKSGKLVSAVNLMSHRKGAFNARHNSFTQKVGANYIQIRMQSMPGGVGSIQYTITYKLSGSSLKLSKTTYPVTYSKSYNPLLGGQNMWKCAKSLNIKNAPNGNIIYTTDAYEVCTVNNIKYSGGSAYIYIRAEDADISGWVRCPNSYTSRFFEESLFI